MDQKWRLLHALWSHRTKLVVLMLIVLLVAPRPVRAQFGIDLGAIIAAIDSIGSAIANTIGPALRTMNNALGTLNNLMNTIQAFFANIVYPQASINRAQGLVGAIQGLYTQILATSHVNVASATLANPQQLERVLLSRNPMNVPSVTANYQTLYQTVPVPQNASPQTRDLIDMSDAAAQAAMKRAIAIDAIADTEMQAADQINSGLAQAAPGSAPMIEAEAAAWLVRANAYTQSALGDVMRLRAVTLANSSAQLKFNASNGAQIRQNAMDSLK
jgi:hypothetical protein